jgi:hypothetical protein
MQNVTYCVIVIKDNVVNNSFGFSSFEKAESMFVDQVIDHEGNQSSDELSGAIEEGYWEFKDNGSVCLTSITSRV